MNEGWHNAAGRLDASKRLLAKFDLRGLAGTVRSAELRLWGHVNGEVQLKSAQSDTWTDREVTAANAPAEGSVLGTFPTASTGSGWLDGAWSTLDITSHVEAQRTADGFASFWVTSSAGKWVRGADDNDYPPVLMVYCDDPSEPGTRKPISVLLQNGTTGALSPAMRSTVPAAFGLAAATNPVSGGAVLRYAVPAVNGRNSTPVDLHVFDLHGRLAATAVDGLVEPGYYSFDMSQAPGGTHAHVVYVARLRGLGYSRSLRVPLAARRP
jgi:hypothetical protein